MCRIHMYVKITGRSSVAVTYFSLLTKCRLETFTFTIFSEAQLQSIISSIPLIKPGLIKPALKANRIQTQSNET